MAVFREWQVRRMVGHDGLIVTADMTSITLEAKASPRQRRLIALDGIRGLPAPLRRIVRRGIWELGVFDFGEGDIAPQPIETSPTYRRMADLWEHRADPSRSHTWQEIEAGIARTGRFRHKNYEITARDQIPDLIEDCYLDLLRSMAEQGYMPGKKAAFATAGIGLALIGRDGHLISGPAATHRKAAARITGARGGFPLRIAGAHRDWLRENGLIRPRDLRHLPALLPNVGGVVSLSEGDHISA